MCAWCAPMHKRVWLVDVFNFIYLFKNLQLTFMEQMFYMMGDVYFHIFIL